ncbi:AtpZ/AtpI family protein [Aquisphaera giovannonii]|uniref:AtpZ/AtpI family protein n=1 Tax=Aquisphaera giovannonii TaxID=406548 RepID=UPI001AEFE970|nr:AtpZ/AtpI family protein [Aquisphaera giovannonii]
MRENPDERSALSIGMEWGTRVTTIGMEFALPALLGFGVDRWLGTTPWVAMAGAIAGVAIGMTHVLRLPAELARGARGDGPARKAGRGGGPKAE